MAKAPEQLNHTIKQLKKKIISVTIKSVKTFSDKSHVPGPYDLTPL